MTNAPTTRETADHAEMARLADWCRTLVDPGDLRVGPNMMREALHQSADALEALLSEIAALRVREAALIDGKTDMFRRATQAERQRDELLSFVRKLDCECDPSFSTASCGRCVQLANQGADQ